MPLTTLLESGADEIEQAAQHLSSQDIPHEVTLAEDCKPGT